MLVLGHDVLEISLLPMLEPNELLALRGTCRELNNLVLASGVWQDLYHRDFGPKPYEDSQRWSELYIRRRAAKVFFWGIYSSESDGEGVAPRPIVLPGVDHPIRDVLCTPGFVLVLDVLGQLWRVGFSVKDGEKIVKKAQQLTSGGVASFVAVHCSYFEIMACDARGVWHLWSAVDGSNASFKLPHQGAVPDLVAMSALTPLKLFYAPPTGIVLASVICAKKGTDVRSVVIPHTDGTGDNEIVSLAMGVGSQRSLAACQFMAYVTQDGNLYLASIPLDHLNHLHLEALGEIVITPFPFYDRVAGPRTRFIKVAADCNRFVGLTDNGRVLEIKLLEGTIFGEIGMRIVPNLHNVVDLALGFGHSVALTSDGEIKVWGCDSAHSGCLGLGSDEELLKCGARYEKGIFDDREILDIPQPVACSPAVCVHASLASTVALGLTSYDDY